MKIVYLLILFLLILFWQSCNQGYSSCCDPQRFNYFPVSETARNKTPYFTNPAFDTITFVSHEEDTVIFVKIKTDSTWYCEYASSNPDNNTQDCYQILHNTYKTIRGVGTFEVKHSKRNESKYSDAIEVIFNQQNIFINDWIVGEKKYPTFISNVQIAGKTYTDLTRVTLNNGTGFSYLNKANGMFYFENIINSSNWHLNK
ncbi:MAG: hypothetical protein V4620_00120 [Bacteroidota bacterium]